MDKDTKNEFENLAGIIKRSFDHVDKRFDKIENRLERIKNLILSEHKRRIEMLETQMKQIKDLLAIQ